MAVDRKYSGRAAAYARKVAQTCPRDGNRDHYADHGQAMTAAGLWGKAYDRRYAVVEHGCGGFHLSLRGPRRG